MCKSLDAEGNDVTAGAQSLHLFADDWRLKPIPAASASPTALNYKQVSVDLKHPKNRQNLVMVKDYGVRELSWYARQDGLNAPYFRYFKKSLSYVWCRSGVALKLAEMNQLLRRYGVEVMVLDGYRPVELQQELWDHFIAIAKVAVAGGTEDDWVKFAGEFCSDPRSYKERESKTWPAHFIGTSVDLVLVELATGQMCYFGSIFDDASKRSNTRYFEENFDPTSQSDEMARANRRLLYWAAAAVGLVNYPGEFWHMDDEDSQFGLYNRGLTDRLACYGPTGSHAW